MTNLENKKPFEEKDYGVDDKYGQNNAIENIPFEMENSEQNRLKEFFAIVVSLTVYFIGTVFDAFSFFQKNLSALQTSLPKEYFGSALIERLYLSTPSLARIIFFHVAGPKAKIIGFCVRFYLEFQNGSSINRGLNFLWEKSSDYMEIKRETWVDIGFFAGLFSTVFFVTRSLLGKEKALPQPPVDPITELIEEIKKAVMPDHKPDIPTGPLWFLLYPIVKAVSIGLYAIGEALKHPERLFPSMKTVVTQCVKVLYDEIIYIVTNPIAFFEGLWAGIGRVLNGGKFIP